VRVLVLAARQGLPSVGLAKSFDAMLKFFRVL
jgi:hypothetical protein